jgi:hypothetical protein
VAGGLVRSVLTPVDLGGAVETPSGQRCGQPAGICALTGVAGLTGRSSGGVSGLLTPLTRIVRTTAAVVTTRSAGMAVRPYVAVVWWHGAAVGGSNTSTASAGSNTRAAFGGSNTRAAFGGDGTTDMTAAPQPAGGPTQHMNGHRHLCRLSAGSDRRPIRGDHRADVVGARDGPVQPLRAPIPGDSDLGLLAVGVPASGSVSHDTGGGAFAVAPTAVADQPATGRRANPAREVAARRPLADTPTVSPD